MQCSRSRYRLFSLVAGVTVVATCAGGCTKSDRIGVSGKVTRDDGSPLVSAKVTFRSPGTGKTAIGYTDDHGHYELGTSRPGEGVLPDGYYITVTEDRGPEEAMKPPTVNEKYTRPGDSGLKMKVTADGYSVYDMVLDPP
jgi:hypothetical protein